MHSKFKKDSTFAPTVLATLKSERIAYQGESFAFIGFQFHNNIPPLPLLNHSECTLRRFFHLSQSPEHAIR